jgi:uncharacterized protein
LPEVLIGVGPKKIQNALPVGQYPRSPTSTVSAAVASSSASTGIEKYISSPQVLKDAVSGRASKIFRPVGVSLRWASMETASTVILILISYLAGRGDSLRQSEIRISGRAGSVLPQRSNKLRRASRWKDERALRPIEFDLNVAYHEIRLTGTLVGADNDMNVPEAKENAPVESFALEGNLGATAKWLRVLGFDADCPADSSVDYDYYVTTRKAARIGEVIIVEEGSALCQVRQVLEQSGIKPDSERLLSRCLACNEPVQAVPKDAVKGKVPEGIFDAVPAFTQCHACRRVYWDGSHRARMVRALEQAGIPLDE